MKILKIYFLGKKERIFYFQLTDTKNIMILTPRWPSLSLHAERVSWMYQSGNKHENYENQIINGGNNTVFQRKK